MENLEAMSEKDIESFLKERRKPEFRELIIEENIALVKRMIADSVNEDTFIIQSISSIGELDRICNTLSKRLREWYGYYFPELSRHIVDNEVFVERLLQKTKKDFMDEYNINISMGPELKDNDLNAIMSFARQVNDLYWERENIIKYLEALMKNYCPNLYTLTGTLIGAKLIEKAGSLKNLAMMPSSAIQLLGAEQALFRHLRNKKIRPPKHGFILSHPYVMNAKKAERGKFARQFSAKISIACRVDYFKGEFIADKLKEELEK